MKSPHGVISGARVTYEHASVDELATACAVDDRDALMRLLDDSAVREAFVLQTCNRGEWYVVTDDPSKGQAALQAVTAGLDSDLVVSMDHEESLEHILRVAAGLESLVIGEDQVLGQVREAYETACDVGAVGPMLDDALLKAIHVGERARTETAINEGVVSLGSAAVELAGERVDLADATALVVGVGEMGTLAAKAFEAAGVDRVLIANRTFVAAEQLSGQLSVVTEPYSLDDLPLALTTADVVVTATGSPVSVIDEELLAGAGDTVVIDIAQPRDVEPAAGALENVSSFDIDDLETVTAATREERAVAADSVAALVDTELTHLLEQYKRKRADEVIKQMYAGASRIKEEELATTFAKLEAESDLTEEQRDVIRALADALVGQLLAAPTQSLRDAAAEDDWTTINTALQLFDPAIDEPVQALVESLAAGTGTAVSTDD